MDFFAIVNGCSYAASKNHAVTMCFNICSNQCAAADYLSQDVDGLYYCKDKVCANCNASWLFRYKRPVSYSKSEFMLASGYYQIDDICDGCLVLKKRLHSHNQRFYCERCIRTIQISCDVMINILPFFSNIIGIIDIIRTYHSTRDPSLPRLCVDCGTNYRCSLCPFNKCGKCCTFRVSYYNHIDSHTVRIYKGRNKL